MTLPLLSVILLAGGKGLRMGHSIPKQFHLLKGKPLALYSFEFFRKQPSVQEIIVVCDPAYEKLFTSPSTHFALPGIQRQLSVLSALSKLSPKADLVCIHDAARPFLSQEDFERVVQVAAQEGAAALAEKVRYTLKETDPSGYVMRTLDRTEIWEVHTPQVLRASLLQKGLPLLEKATLTDDVSLVELLEQPVKLVPITAPNLKLTYPGDWVLAESLLSQS